MLMHYWNGTSFPPADGGRPPSLASRQQSKAVWLQQVEQATRAEFVGGLLGRYLPELAAGTPCARPVTRVEVLKHRRGRWCRLKYQLCGSTPDRVIGQVVVNGGGRRLFAAQEYLWRQGFGRWADDQIMVRRPLTYIAELDMPVLADAQGQPISLTGDTLDLVRRAANRSAEALVKLHNVQLAGLPTAAAERLPRRCRCEDLIRLHRQADAVEALPGDWAAALRPLHGQLRRWGGELREVAIGLTLIHGAFEPNRLLVAGRRLTVTGLEQLAVGDPALDVAHFTAHLKLLALTHPAQAQPLEMAAALFADEYTRRRLAGMSFWRRAAFYEAAALFQALLIVARLPDQPALSQAIFQRLEAAVALA